jgi:hypothetical protein
MALPAEGVDGLLATVITEAYQLYQFRRWGPWDAQRVGRKYRYEFVDYATVIIGLYAAAAGIPRDDILQIENYVANTSNYDKGTKFDKTYTHLLL